MSKNHEIALIFRKMARLLEIKGEIIFKIRAYEKAAENIALLQEDIALYKNENRLSEIPGVGAAIRDKIIEYLDSEKIAAYEKLTAEIPESLLELVNIPSVGPKKAKLFYETCGVKCLKDLLSAIKEGKLKGLAGIKDKTLQKIIEGINVVEAGEQRMNLGAATKFAEQFIAVLKKLPEVKQISTGGSLRRGKETVGDIDILVESEKPAKIIEVFTSLPQVKTIQGKGDTKASILTDENIQVDLRVVDSTCFGAALLYFTGGKNFNIRIRQIAMEKQMKVSEYGIFQVREIKKGKNIETKETLIAGKTEEQCLKALGLPFVEPELREDIGEEELFSGKKIPKLITEADIKGDLHVHSRYSDGRNSIEEVGEAAIAKGYEYIGICDHSPKLIIAGGVSEEDLKKKKKEIDAFNKRTKNFRILFGTEVEIDMKGDLDYNDDILAQFDLVIAAVHSGFSQSEEDMTARLIRACQNRHVNIIAHPTGVNIGKRDPYKFDLKKVCQVAHDHNVCLEINSFPNRLDLNSQNVYFARSQKVRFAINTDSHNINQLDYIKFGISVARRGWLTKADVINTLSLSELKKTLLKKNV
jgi:DNA polymerase (family 10)